MDLREEHAQEVRVRDVVAKIGLELGVAAQLRGAGEHPFERVDVVLGKIPLIGVLRGGPGGGHQGRGCRQRLGLAAALTEILGDHGGRADYEVFPAVLGGAAKEGAGGVPGDDGQDQHEGQGNADPGENEPLSELLRVTRRVYGAKVWWVSRAGKAV